VVAAYKRVLLAESLADQSPSSGPVGLLRAIAAFVVFVLFGLNGVLGAASQCSAKRALGLKQANAGRVLPTRCDAMSARSSCARPTPGVVLMDWDSHMHMANDFLGLAPRRTGASELRLRDAGSQHRSQQQS
jgi:hypothetical protein